ncbi:hypothetical protein [Terricaulis sp.]|uniref:hypothetical protein n=1 Tax=Terricaulis sp. TaxID=2768686 RepID=UPI0037831F48
MRIVVLAAALALAAACTPDAANQSAASCAASASTTWQAEGAPALTIDANTSGPDCANAVATYVVRAADHSVIWAEIYHADQVMVLAGAANGAEMQTKLGEWVAFDNHTMASTSALPEWPANAETPQNGEFPFYPEDDVTREIYTAIRAANAPMFCYAQGMESQRCLAWYQNTLVSVGVQTFPG